MASRKLPGGPPTQEVGAQHGAIANPVRERPRRHPLRSEGIQTPRYGAGGGGDAPKNNA